MPSPTPAELAILEVLWARGPATVREVHEALEQRGTGYTTVLKLMQIMAGKGLLHRDERQRSHVYAPTIAQADVQGRLVDELVERAFAGSTSALVMRALGQRPASDEELAQIRALLDQIEGKPV
ncbi:BlaI/MecI/CopY family transcriptional regulator [Nannocystaceae bacterium ST9]